MNRNRSSINRPEKKTSISSISSNIPLTASSSDQDTRRSSKPADVQTFLDSMKMTSNSDSKRGRPTCPPKGAVPYTVNSHDTLEKIALHFNSTPSELIHINKMSTRILFPGQIIFVPENSGEEVTAAAAAAAVVPSVPVSVTSKDSDALIRSHDRCSSHESLSPPSSHQHDVGQMIWSMSRQSSTARPGRAQRLKSDASAESDSSSRTIEERLRTQKVDNYRQLQQIQHTLSIEESQRLDEECLQRFIKVHVCLMTEDRKSVAGTLLVTPNAVMFDPDVLDPLVKDFGIEKFGLIIRMDLLAGIALYEDIAMYEHEATLRDDEKRRMAQSTSIKNLYQTTTTKIIDSDEEQIKEIMHSIIDQIEKKTDNETVPLVLFDASSAAHRALTPDQSYPLLSDDLVSTIDIQKHSTTILFDSKDYEQDQSRLQLEDCIPVNNFSKRFGEIDKLLQKQHEFYVTPHPIEIPYYLCVRISQLGNDRSPHSSRITDDVYGKKELDTEYWFSVPKEKVDHLYAFFLRWSPERETSESSSKSDQPTTKSVSSNHINRSSSQHQVKHHETLTNKGFVLLSNDDSETIDDYLSSEPKNNSNARGRNSTSDSNKEQKKSHYLKRQNTLLKEWEIINVDEIYRRINETQANNSHLAEFETIPAPKFLQPSTIIDELKSKEILLELPARVHGLNWQLVFSTELNGFSLNQLYRRGLEVDQDLPSLLIVKDVEQNIFGAYISQQMMISEGFYGTGESFLYTFYPHFQVFKWTGHNQFFVKGDTKAVGIGCGEGIYGLWLDGDLYHGRTCPSKTFDNPQLSSSEDFIIASVEVWTFVD